MSGPLARLVAWLRSLGGDETAVAETDEPAPAAQAGVCAVCGTAVPEPDGLCSLCGSADVRRAGTDGTADAATGETGDDRGAASDDVEAGTDAAAASDPGPARRSVADTTDDDAARLSELRRRGGADDAEGDDGTDDAESDA
jgi:hypothetical protein